MNTFKKLTALLLTFILITVSNRAVLGKEVYVDGDLYCEYSDEFLIYPDFKAAAEKLEKYAAKGDYEKVNEVYIEELSPLEMKYTSILEYNELFEELDFIPAECEFDKETGTVIKVLNDAEFLAIPVFIDDVPVTHIAEGAICDKEKLVCLGIPPFVEVIDSVIVKNCPSFEMLDAYWTKFTTLFFENCPSYDRDSVYLFEDSSFTHFVSITNTDTLYYTTNLGMGFAIDSGIIKGDEKGEYNWKNDLTRTEAAIIILRLMGLEDEAYSYSEKHCAFADVPEWAKGYVNLAVEKGIVKGRSENHFGSSEKCSAKDFLTMLFRLTDLEEGKDYSWQTIISDYQNHLDKLEDNLEAAGYKTPDNNFYSTPPLNFRMHGEEFSSYINMGGNFNRQCATFVLYYMLNITAGKDDLSLADILSSRYGMNDILLYNYYARRTGAGLKKTNEDIPYPIYHAFSDEEGYLSYLRDISKNAKPSEINSEIKAFTESLIAGKSTEYEKAKTITKWVSEHIFYDHDHYEGRKKEVFLKAIDVFENRFTVCSGYAALLSEMLKAAGIECYTESSLNHAWTVAVLDGELTLIDATWASPLKYEYGKYYKLVSGNKTEVKNIKEPNAKWDNDYFDAEFEYFYLNSFHHPLRIPKQISSEIWDYLPEEEY